jgi:hypothetical protein
MPPPLPSLELSVWNRVGARAAHARDAGIPAPLKTIPRREDLVGARFERMAQVSAWPGSVTILARLSHW